MNTNMKFAATGQRIELTEPVMLVAGTMNIYTASFAFDSAWEGHTKTAVFRGGDVEREQMLTDDSCEVPWEVLLPGAYLKVGVYGTMDGSRLPTIWTERTQYINAGAGPTDEATEPSPTLVEQLTAKVGNLDALKTEDKSSVVAAINEVWASGGGGSGASVTDAAINEDGHLIITLSTGKQIDAGYAVGPAGADGQDGANGKSAYQYAKDGGYTGTEAEFAAKMAAEIPAVDTTLTESGKAADAAAVGARLSSLSEEIVTTAESKVSAHNTGTDTHSDIRLLIQGLSDRLSAVADSDDSTLDQLSEIVAYIKSNKSLIDAITTSKVNVADIVDNLTTNVANKPLSAAQGVALKALIDAISVPDKLPNPNALTFSGAASGSYDGSAPVNVEIPSGGDAGKRVRHIATVSVTEGTTSYNVTVDSNGDALNLESVYILTNNFWGNTGSYVQVSINRRELTRAYGQSGSPQVLELEKMGELQKLTNIPKPSNVGISFGDYYNGKSAVTSVGFWSATSTVNTTIEIYGVDA